MTREPPYHYHIGFSASVFLWDVERFLACFGEPEPNPIPKSQRGQR